MFSRSLLLVAYLFFSLSASAIEPGDLIVARGELQPIVGNEKVDRIGPGQVLRVLKVEADRLWISRGRPGWVLESEVMPIAEAESHFEKPFASSAGPRDFLARGTVRIAIGRTDDGIADLEKAVSMTSQPGEFLESLGYAQLAAKLQPAAIETFNNALKGEPDSSSALMGRGLAFYQVGQYRNAITDFTKAIELNPGHGFPRKYLGVLYHDIGRMKEARASLQSALQIDTYDVFTRNALGRLYYDMGDYRSSLREFSIAVEIDSSDIEAVAGRGVVRHAIGRDLKGAAEDFARAMKLGKATRSNAYLWSNLGQVQSELGDGRNALRNLDKAIELDPSFNEARSHRAYLLATAPVSDAEVLKKAKADLEQVFDSSEPKTYWDYRALASVNARLGDYQRALKYQSLGESALRRHGPPRFLKPAIATIARYKAALRQ